MRKEILENQALQAHMLFFDPPDKLIQLRNPFPKTLPSDPTQPLEKLLQMQLVELEPAVKVLDNGDVRFRFYAPEAKAVEVSGLDGGFPPGRHAMAKGNDGWWSLVVSGILSGFHYHEYFVDGNQLVNPDAQCGYGLSRILNFFDLPSDGDEFWMLRDVLHGDVRMEYYPSSAAGIMKRAWVYTPPGYDYETRRYPVLYLEPGEGENETGWIWQGRVNLIADNLIADGKCEKLIMVIPGNSCAAGADPACIAHIDAKYRTLAGKRSLSHGTGACSWDARRLWAYETLQTLYKKGGGPC